MSHTLLLRLQGPMQAWGVQSRFTVRETTREPTKSGVIGLLCAALGRDRSEQVADLYELHMGVRVDREGRLMADFQTARGAHNAEGNVLKSAVISTRYYLADAVFLVGLESSDLALLRKLDDALHHPRWLLCLGRRAFPAAQPVWLKENGLQESVALETALAEFPWLVHQPQTPYQRDKLPKQLRFIYEQEDGPISRSDAPVSYAERLFARRHVAMTMGNAPTRFLDA